MSFSAFPTHIHRIRARSSSRPSSLLRQPPPFSNLHELVQPLHRPRRGRSRSLPRLQQVHRYSTRWRMLGMVRLLSILLLWFRSEQKHAFNYKMKKWKSLFSKVFFCFRSEQIHIKWKNESHFFIFSFSSGTKKKALFASKNEKVKVTFSLLQKVFFCFRSEQMHIKRKSESHFSIFSFFVRNKKKRHFLQEWKSESRFFTFAKKTFSFGTSLSAMP